MVAVTKVLLSGSTNGRNIKITQTATAGDLLHTATSAADTFDEVWLSAMNTSGADVLLTLELGGVTSPDDLLEVTIPGEDGAYQILNGQVYNGGVVIRAFAASANVINITGYVNRIDQS